MNLLSDCESEGLELDKYNHEDKATMSTYEEPQNSKYKGGSLKASFLLALVPNVPESHYNVFILMNCLNLDKIKHSFVADLKLCQIMCGLSPCAMATQPCHICEWKRMQPFKEEKLRTFGFLEEQYTKFFQSGAIKRNAKEFCYVINPPLIHVETSDHLVADYLFPPELHLMEGAVNHIYNHIEKCDHIKPKSTHCNESNDV